MNFRPARSEDSEGISRVLRNLVAAGKRKSGSDPGFVRDNYTDHPDRIQCTVAVDDDGTILGFQSLRLARDGNPFGTPTGWGIIGTHIGPTAARRGIGAQLFEATKQAAINAGITKIEACIGASNPAGLAYYEAMGFRTYASDEGAIRKAYTFATNPVPRS